jgi:uncharacterized repeat protein (TIGR03803 family)
MVTPTGIETVLHSFSKDGTDGILPGNRLISDAKGNLYGTAGGGPNDWGVVFKLAPDGTETIVASFTNSKRDGSGPAGGVVREGHGRLYGTAPRGGSFKCSNGCGTIFRITP